jgi:hypothetical protein
MDTQNEHMKVLQWSSQQTDSLPTFSCLMWVQLIKQVNQQRNLCGVSNVESDDTQVMRPCFSVCG